MTSFASKLARLPPPPEHRAAGERAVPDASASVRAAPDGSGPAPEHRPSLDELRDRIARIVARGDGSSQGEARRADPSHTELPFVLEQTDCGPLYVSREREALVARVGRVPLVAARDADPLMLSLLALDPSLATCDPRRALFLDTETTGLSGGTGTVAFLVGLSWFDTGANAFVMEQILLRRLGEEAPMLKLVAQRIADASMIVTFNGKTFDWPLLRTRFVLNRMEPPAHPPHLDLLHVARRIHRERLKERTLVAIENHVLGRGRIGDIPGGEIVAVYAHFLRTGDESALQAVVDHNAADVLAMVALVGLYGEPLDGLDGADLAGVARTLRRAGHLSAFEALPLNALDRAAEFAEEAVLRGGGAGARRARGDIAKARGDRARALADYEALASEVDDPSVRLELAKLYEHHARHFDRALEMVELGTGEPEHAHARRRDRLRRKIHVSTTAQTRPEGWGK
jgi:uncharacterized protein